MSLYSGKRIHGYKWDRLPIDENIIARVEQLAEAEKQPIMNRGMPCFEWTPGVEIEDEPDEEDEQQLTISNGCTEVQERHQEIEDVQQEPEQLQDVLVDIDPDIADNGQVNIGDEVVIQNDEDGMIVLPEENIVSEEEDFTEPEDEAEDFDDYIQESEEEDEVVAIAPLDDEEPDVPIRTRPRRENAGAGVERMQMDFSGKGYGSTREFNFVTNGVKVDQNTNDQSNHTSYMNLALNTIFTQMSANAGFKKFGEPAFAAMIKEFTQLNEGAVPGKPVVVPTDANTLTDIEKEKALPAVNLIKKKWNGVIKGRSCVDGSKQRKYLKQDESVASPTASLESLFASLLIDAHEGRDVGTYDVPGAYLQARLAPKENNERVLMKLRGTFVDIMCKVNPEHLKNVIYENGKKVLYMEILQAIYGCIESALRWYELYSTTLEKEGFIINPYDRCVANKMINGEQCTVVWYVDDNKVSHKDPRVVDEIIELMKGHFGELTVTRGNKHRFLGMNITINKNRHIEVEMKEQLENVIKSFNLADGNMVTEVVTSPARPHLRDVDPGCTPLNAKKSESFHSIVATLLWIMKRARPDLETAVGFLCTRVSKSDDMDWKKLRRTIAFIRGTIDDVRIIGADSLSKIYTWVDAAYGVTADMKSQTGGAMSLGMGILHGKSSKQKLNVKSSTEAELVGVSDYLPYNIWLLMFLSAQGYEITDNVLYQDNQSTILMLKNGRNSCTGNSRHVHIRYFFVKDRVEKGEVKVEYCPTLQMVADYFTKPLQGSLFNKLRDVIMGYKSIYTLQ